MNLSKLQEIVEDRGAWHATVHGVTKSQIWFSDSTTTRRWDWKGNTSPALRHRVTYFCLCSTQTSLLAVAWVRYFEKHCQGDGSLSVLRACHSSDFKDLNCKNPAVLGQPVPVLDSCQVLQCFPSAAHPAVLDAQVINQPSVDTENWCSQFFPKSPS